MSIDADGGRGTSIGQDCRAHRDDNLADIFKVGYFHALLGPSWKGRASWWLISNWVWKYHRKLNPQRPIHRNGPNLLPSLWSQEMVSSNPNLSENALSTPTCVHTNLTLMAKHRAHLSMVGPGPRDHKSC